LSDLDFKVKNGLVVNNNLLVATNGKISVNTTSPLTTFHINTADALILPVGGSGSRPSANDGMIRYNTDLKAFEGSMEGNWSVIMQSNTNSSIFSTILVSEVDFDSTANTKIKAGANSIVLYTGNSAALTVSNSSLQSYSLTANSTAITVNNALISNVSTLYIGNSTVNAVINSTSAKFSNSTSSFTLNIPTSTQVSNGSYFLNANGSYGLVMFSPSGSNTQLQFNDSDSWGASAGLVFNKTSNNLTVSNTVTATTFVGNLNGTSNNATYLNGVAASGYQTTAGLSANVATLTSNNASNLGGQSPSYYANTTFTYYIGTSALSINRVSAPQTLTGISIDGTSNNATYLNGVAASGYQTTAGLSANVATLTSNNASNLGGQSPSYYANTTFTYYIGTSALSINRVSAPQTLTGISIDGTSNNITSYTIDQNLGSNDTPTFKGLYTTDDIRCYRTSNPNTGVVYLTQDATRYLCYDGTYYVLSGAELIVNGTPALRSGQPASISNLIVTGDIKCYRTANPNTGVVFLTQDATRYLFYNGSNYEMPAAELSVNGTWVLRSGQPASISSLTITGSLTANGTYGSAGQVLHSNGTVAYWDAYDNGVTSVATGNGLSGGPITTAGTISVLANSGLTANSTGLFVIPGNGVVASNSTGIHVGAGNGITINSISVGVLANSGIVANSTGLFVNSSYIATLTSNNATYLNGVAASGYQTTAGLSANVATLTSNNTTYLGGRSVGTSANNIIALDGNSKLPAVDGSQLTNIKSVKSNIRQTVSSGPTSTGSPSILAATYASLVVTTQNVSNSAPLIVSAANGYSATGDNDYIGSSTSNLSWTVASSNTSYLPVSVTSAGVVAAANPVTLKPVYQQYGTPSTTSGQYTFNIQEMKMYLGNGSVANQVNHVIIGHVVSGASTVTSTVVYAYNGYYESGWVATFPAAGTSVSKNSNLGVGLGKGRLLALVTSEIGNYSVNDIIENFYAGQAGPVYGPVSVVTTDTTVGFVTGAASIGTWNKTTGAAVSLAGSASVSYQLIHERSW